MKNTHLVTDGCASRTARSTFAGALLLKTVLLLAVALVSLPFNSWSVLLSYLPRERGVYSSRRFFGTSAQRACTSSVAGTSPAGIE